jgi:uncharacterized protein
LKSVIWESKTFNSIEYCALSQDAYRFILKGTTILLKQPSIIRYLVECDKCWKTRVAQIRQEREGKVNSLALRTNAEGIWFEGKAPLTLATGLLDIDFEFSPATNTLPINRLNLNEGESKEVDSLWIRSESLKTERLRQRYSRLDLTHYKYEVLSFDFESIIEVDELGLVVNYGNLWHRNAEK